MALLLFIRCDAFIGAEQTLVGIVLIELLMVRLISSTVCRSCFGGVDISTVESTTRLLLALAKPFY